MFELGKRIYDKLEELSEISCEGEGITRLYLTEEHKRANKLLQKWMEEIGLAVELDNVGNLIGTYNCGDKDAKTLVLGSHQDTVRSGGKYDGAMGVVLPLYSLENAIKSGNVPCNVKIISFGDEEGVRFGTTYLGSKAVCGTFGGELLEKRDDSGKTLSEAIKDFGLNPQDIASCKLLEKVDGYLEVHIEQGPILESKDLAVGVVTAIQSSHRYEISIKGVAGHAATVPMGLRNDAVFVMSEAIYELLSYVKSEQNLLATIGKINVFPGAINVIPSEAIFTLDIRCIDEGRIEQTIKRAEQILEGICAKNSASSFSIKRLNKVPATYCSDAIIDKVEEAVKACGVTPFKLASGPGHDAQEMANITDIGMLFVRCKEGISHNPAESVTVEDTDVAARVVVKFIEDFA